jgi:hypothetical protein
LTVNSSGSPGPAPTRYTGDNVLATSGFLIIREIAGSNIAFTFRRRRAIGSQALLTIENR